MGNFKPTPSASTTSVTTGTNSNWEGVLPSLYYLSRIRKKMATVAATLREEARRYNLNLVQGLRSKITQTSSEFLTPLIVNKKYVDRSKIANLLEIISDETEALKARIEKAKTIGPVVAGKWGKKISSLEMQVNLLQGTYKAAQQTSKHIQDSLKSIRKKISLWMKELGPRFQEPEIASFQKLLLETRARLTRHSKKLYENFQNYIDRYDAPIESHSAHDITTTLMAIAMAEKQLGDAYKKVSVPKRYVYTEDDMVFDSQSCPGSVTVWDKKGKHVIGAIIKAIRPFVLQQTGEAVKANDRFFLAMNPKIKFVASPGSYKEVKQQVINNIDAIMEQVNG